MGGIAVVRLGPTRGARMLQACIAAAPVAAGPAWLWRAESLARSAFSVQTHPVTAANICLIVPLGGITAMRRH